MPTLLQPPPLLDSPLDTEELLQLSQAKQSLWYKDESVTFLYQGHDRVQNVELAGELTRWHKKGLKLKKTANSLYHLTLKLPLNTRLEYKFLVDDTWTLDPWNPNQVDSGIGSLNSYLTMPAYLEDPFTHIQTSVPKGLIKSFYFTGQNIPGRRRIQVYLPPFYTKEKQYSVLYIHDGNDYIERGNLPVILDNLIHQKRIKPAIAVFIDPIERYREYTLNPAYCELLAKEIVPWVDRSFATHPHPISRVLLGSSLGGLISMYMAYHYSHIFGKVLGQSSAFQYFGERLVHTIKSLQAHPIRLYLSAGIFEGLIQANRNMQTVLTQKGYDFQYDEYAEGHNWSHWKHRLSRGLEYLLGK